MSMDFDKIKVEERDHKMLFLNNAKQECYDVFDMTQQELKEIMRDEELSFLDFDPQKPLFRQSHLHYVVGKPYFMRMMEVKTFPPYIYSPLRVLNPYVHTEPDFLLILDELDQIITRGDLTFTEEFPFGFSSLENIPFSLSYLKLQTIIMLVNQSDIDECQGRKAVGRNKLGCYVSGRFLAEAYLPVIMICPESIHTYAQKNGVPVKDVYHSTILELFAYNLLDVSAWVDYDCEFRPDMPIWDYPINLEITQAHRDFAVAFAKRYMENPMS